MRVLIVNDDNVSRALLKASLKKLGHEITEAANGMEALEAFDRHPAPAVFSHGICPECLEKNPLKS